MSFEDGISQLPEGNAALGFGVPPGNLLRVNIWNFCALFIFCTFGLEFISKLRVLCCGVVGIVITNANLLLLEFDGLGD